MFIRIERERNTNTHIYSGIHGSDKQNTQNVRVTIKVGIAIEFTQSMIVLRIVEKRFVKMISIKVILVLGLALTVASEQVSKDGARYICMYMFISYTNLYFFATSWSVE